MQQHYRNMLRRCLVNRTIAPDLPEEMVFEILCSTLCAGIAYERTRAAAIPPTPIEMLPLLSGMSSGAVSALQPIKDELRAVMRHAFSQQHPNRKETMI